MANLIVTPTTSGGPLGGGGPPRRVTLGPGTTRLGGPGADVELPGVATGALVVEGPPWRVSRVTGSANLEHAGRESASLDLTPGARFTWAGLAFEFEGDVEVLEADAGRATPAAAPAWRWLKAGLAVDLGLADRDATRRVQDAVRAGEFRTDAASSDLLSATRLADDDPRLEQRAARLFRDLVMAPTMRGFGKTARAGRGCFRSLLAFVVVQVGGLVVFALLIAALLLGLRWQGRSLDAEANRILELIPGLPDPPPAAPPDEPR